MPHYCDRDAVGRPDEILVIEDARMVLTDPRGRRRPGYAYIDANTIRAHPFIIDALLENAERLWSLEEILAERSRPDAA